MNIDAEKLRAQLQARDYRHIFQQCGFDINGERGPELKGVLGPKQLGEGETGNFSLDLEEGLAKDWGSSGYQGDVFDVVKEVQNLDFPSALQWIVDELSLNASEFTSSGRSNGPSQNGSQSPEEQGGSDREQVATHQQVAKWHERLMGDTDAAQSARTYLTDTRAIDTGVLKATSIGLAHRPNDSWSKWWVTIPVTYRIGDDPSPVIAVKRFAFEPSQSEWKRDDRGRKIPRNDGSAALYDLVPQEPNESPVVVCEGEIDALSALSHGFNAVTGTAGASTFKQEWASYLEKLKATTRHPVIVTFDGDDAGREAAPEAARLLYDAGLDVRVASLPEGEDVNDVLVSGGSDALQDHLDAAEIYQPDGMDVYPLLGTEEPPPMQWRIEDLVPEDHLTMLVGDGGTGKSLLALHLSLCVCMGRPFLGTGVKRGNVLYVDHELDREEQLRRVHRVARGMGIDASDATLKRHLQYWRPEDALGTDAHHDHMQRIVETCNIDLVILDSLTMGATGDVTDVADVVPIMQKIRHWPTTVAIDHVSHSTAQGRASNARAFGSVFKRNAARSSLTLAKSDTGGYAIQQEKSNFSDGDGRLVYTIDWKEKAIAFENISNADERAAGLLSDLSTKDVTLVAIETMWQESNQPVMPSDVVTWREENDVSAIGEGTVRNHFTALKRREDIRTDEHGGAVPNSVRHIPPAGTGEDPSF